VFLIRYSFIRIITNFFVGSWDAMYQSAEKEAQSYMENKVSFTETWHGPIFVILNIFGKGHIKV
jgi:hypothetical protein